MMPEGCKDTELLLESDTGARRIRGPLGRSLLLRHSSSPNASLRASTLLRLFERIDLLLECAQSTAVPQKRPVKPWRSFQSGRDVEPKVAFQKTSAPPPHLHVAVSLGCTSKINLLLFVFCFSPLTNTDTRTHTRPPPFARIARSVRASYQVSQHGGRAAGADQGRSEQQQQQQRWH